MSPGISSSAELAAAGAISSVLALVPGLSGRIAGAWLMLPGISSSAELVRQDCRSLGAGEPVGATCPAGQTGLAGACTVAGIAGQ